MQHAKQIEKMPASVAGIRNAVSDGLTMAIMADTCAMAQDNGFAAFRDTGLPWLDGVTICEDAATEIGWSLSVVRAIGRGEVEDHPGVWGLLYEQVRHTWFCHVAEVDAAAWYRRKTVLADMVGEVAK